MSIFERLRKKHTTEHEAPVTDVTVEQNLVSESAETVDEPPTNIPLDKLNRRVVAAIREMRVKNLENEPGPGVVRNSRYAEEMDRDATPEELEAVLPEAPSEEEETPKEGAEQSSRVSAHMGHSVADYVVPEER